LLNKQRYFILLYLNICTGWCRCCESFWTHCYGKPDYKPRSVYLARPSGPTDQKFPANIIRNQKYSIVTFIPLVCYLQFS